MTRAETVPPTGDFRIARARPDRPRFALMAVLVAAAMPVRLPTRVPVVGSVSILDLLLLVMLGTLLLDLPWRRLNWGYRPIAALLLVPPAASAVSLVWSVDRLTTLRSTIAYLEAIVAYLFATRELEGLTPGRVIRYLQRYAILLITPAVLLLLRVPGFGPEQTGISKTSGDYISYFTRLSHPVLGRSNNLATVLVILVPPLLYWGHTRKDARATAVGVVTLLAVAATQSRGVAVAAITGGLIYLAFLRPRPATPRRPLRGKVTAAAIGLVASGIAFYYFNTPTREFVAGRLSSVNIALRVQLYKDAWHAIATKPLLGYGADAVPPGNLALTVDLHNTYLQQVLEFGLPLGTVVAVAVAAFPVVFMMRRRFDPISGAIGYAVLVEIIAFSFESSFEGMVLRVIFYLTIGLLAGLARATESEAPSSPIRETVTPAEGSAP